MINVRIIIFFIGICFSTPSLGQLFGLPHQERYTISSGLSNNSIMDIEQDSFGFLWIGTADGLNRFDGYQFMSFHPDSEDSTAISDSFISSVTLSAQSELLVATQKGGLNYFQYAAEGFTPLNRSNLSNKQTDFFVQYGQSTILEDDQNAWVGTSEGIAKIPIIQHDTPISFYLPGTTVNAILKDKQGFLWAGTSNGLFHLPPGSTSFIPVEQLNFDQTGEVRIIFEDESGRLIVGTKNGLFLGDLKNWRKISPPSFAGQNAFKNINSIISDNKGRIWMAGQNGLIVLERETFQVRDKEFQILKQNNLDKENIHIIFIDREENLWIGTANNGLIRLFLSEGRFPVFRQNKKPFDGGTSENTVRSIWADSDSTIWLGSYGAGIYRFDKESLSFYNYRSNPAVPYSISGNQISSIYRDQVGTLWVGTWGDGVNKLLSVNGQLQFQRIPLSTNQETDRSQLSEIHQIFEDEYQNLWVVTNGGLAKKEKGDKSFVEVSSNFNIPNFNINDLLEDKEGNWWMGTWNGIYVFDRKQVQLVKKNLPITFKDPIASFYFDKQNPHGLTNSRITCLHQDSKNRVWIGTYGGGLNLWIPKEGSPDKMEGQFNSYTQKDALPNNVIYGIQEDSSSRLWLSTNKGLVLFDPEVEVFQTFTTLDGLQSDQFYFGAYGKTPGGEMIFGGNNGFNIFDPLRFSTQAIIPPKVMLTDFQIKGEKVPVGKRADGTLVLEQSVLKTKEILLQPYDNSFRFEFISPTFNNAYKLKYAYRLLNFQENWQITDHQNRFAIFSNLFEGKYTFEVKASIDGKNWSPVQTLHIRIAPPWFRTWWAYSLAVLFILLFLATISRLSFIYSNLRNKLKLEQLSRQKEAEINEMRMWFFTYISHEFRTPLNLIISPLTELINDLEIPYKIRNKVRIIYRNSRRLLRLVNQILNFRMINSGKLHLKASEQDIISFTKEIYLSFTSLAQERGIQYDFNSAMEHKLIWLDTEKLEIVLYNLLSNAFKYTSDNGAITLDIKEQEDGFLSLSVTDNGTGIPQEEQEKIFTPFYRVPNSKISGSGIGLVLVKSLVELHSGKIHLDSQLGKGSIFKVILPIGNAHLQPEQMVEDTELINLLDQSQQFEEKNGVNGFPNFFANLENKEKPKLLLVEDNLEIRKYFFDQLEPNFRISEASNGKEALDLVHKQVPDLIISDVIMPEMDGITFCKKLKSNVQFSHIPVILLTARTSLIHRLEGFEKGAFEYITKPVNIHLLKGKIFALLQNIERLKAHYKYEGVLPSDNNHTSTEENFLIYAAKVVEEHLGDAEFTAEDFAHKMGVSRSGLYKKLQAITSKSTTQFIRYIRLKHAEKLLKEGHLNISQTAFKVGFNDLKYFRKCFKEEFHMTPSELLKKNNGNGSNNGNGHRNGHLN